jgi:hypothetical protein
MTNGTQQQQKKGLGPLAWIAIGCGVIILVVGIVMVAGTVFVAGKAKDFAEEMERNPGLATARAIVKLNPELEEVAVDEEAGTITVRNTETGEEITVDFEDLKEGKLSFSSGDTSVTIDASEEGVSISGEEGGERLELSTGNQVTEDVPEWVPVWPDAELEGRSTMRHSGGLNGGCQLVAPVTTAEAVEFYRERLDAAGFDVRVSTYSTEDGEGGMVNGTDEAGGRSVVAIISSRAEGGSDVRVTYALTR